MQLVSLIVATAALLVSLAVARWELRQDRHSDQGSALIGLLREHRSNEMAAARRYVYKDIAARDLSCGLDGLPEEEREQVRDLMCFYDTVGVMVAYEVIDADPVVGHLGGSIADMWSVLKPLVLSERHVRQGHVSDPARWHQYFEHLAAIVAANPPPLAAVRRRPAGASRQRIRQLRFRRPPTH